MHIPRQPDGARGAGADGLRGRRQALVRQVRTVAYWQRLVQARTDLVVAGLLYNAPPVPGGRTLPVTLGAPTPATGVHTATVLTPAGSAWAGSAPGGAGRTTPADGDDLHHLAEPPEGLDVARLLSCAEDADGPGARLERLRDAADLLARRRRRLDEELDAVTLALHDRLAADGDAEAATPPTGSVVGSPSALAATRLP